VRRSILAVVLFACSCSSKEDEAREACEAAYAKLEALECEAKMKDLLARGCFELEFRPDDCDKSHLEPCTDVIEPLGEPYPEPLDTFLDRRCGPEGTKTIEWPKPDVDALKAAAEAKAEAEAAAAAKEQEAIAARALEQERESALAAAKDAKIQIGTPTVKGALSKTTVRELVTEHLDGVRECYGKALTELSTVQGKVEVNFVVSGDGTVMSSVVQSSTIADSTASTCIAKAIEGVPFPEPKGGGNAIITVSFTLSPGK
jgi:hypothetical protein